MLTLLTRASVMLPMLSILRILLPPMMTQKVFLLSDFYLFYQIEPPSLSEAFLYKKREHYYQQCPPVYGMLELNQPRHLWILSRSLIAAFRSQFKPGCHRPTNNTPLRYSVIMFIISFLNSFKKQQIVQVQAITLISNSGKIIP